MHPPRSPPEGGSGGSGIVELHSNSSTASSGNDDICSDALLKVDKTTSSRKYDSVSSTQSQHKKINKIFQTHNPNQQVSNLTNKRALKYKSSTINESSLHHMKQRSKSTDRAGGRNEPPSRKANGDSRGNKGKKYTQDTDSRDTANNRLMRNYSSYELNRKPTGNNSFSSHLSSMNGRTPSITSSSTTTASHTLRHQTRGHRMRSKSEDHLLHVPESSCCDGNARTCEECGEESPFYLHDPSTVGYNRLSDLFPQTSSDDSGLCLNSSSHSPNNNFSKNKNMGSRDNGFGTNNVSNGNSSKFRDTHNNKSNFNNSKGSKDNHAKTSSRNLSRPRRAAPLPPIPTQSNGMKHYDRREDRGITNSFIIVISY